MSLNDGYIALRDKLFSTFEATTATVTSTSGGTRSLADRAAGIVNTTSATRSVRAILGTRRNVTQDGTSFYEATAKCDGAVSTGERITIGTSTYIIDTVVVTDPTGSAPIIWLAVLK